MNKRIILASGSDIRREMLKNAGVDFDAVKPMVDENSIFHALIEDGVKPRDIADTLAEYKARKVSQKRADAFVIGCDQVLEIQGKVLQKPKDQVDAVAQLEMLSGSRHTLLSAVVLYENGTPQWRHIGKAELVMRTLSPEYIEKYVDRNWDNIQNCVGCYQLENEGVRLFSRISGDYFTVLGLPLVELLSYLTLRGVLDG